MLPFKSFSILIASLSLCLAGIAQADEGAEKDVAPLIKQLDSSSFADRQAASEKLTEQGQAALELVTKAAESPSREVSRRALEILSKWKDSGKGDLAKQVKQELEKLANSENSRVARRAKTILNPPENAQAGTTPANPGGIQIIGGQGGVIRGNIQIRAIAGGNGVKRIQIQNKNGVKNIDVLENGKKIKIHDDPNNGIEMEITEKKNGKDVTEKIKVKDKEELKKKHPAAYKIYDKYATNNAGGARIQGGPARINIMPVPQIARVNVNKLKNDLNAELEKLKAKLKTSSGEEAKQLRTKIEKLEKMIATVNKTQPEKKATEKAPDEKIRRLPFEIAPEKK